MTPVCAFVFASLCVPQAYAPVTKTWAMYTTPPHGFDVTAVHRRGIEIDVSESDSFQMVLPVAVDRACLQGWCTYYQRHCSASECTYEISNPTKPDSVGVALNIEIDIRGRSKEILRKTVHDLSLAMGTYDARPAGYLPLASFDREARSDHIIGCSRSVWFEGCERPRFPQAGRPAHL